MLNDDLSVGATGSEPLRVHDGTHGLPACTEQHVEGTLPDLLDADRERTTRCITGLDDETDRQT
jgi:hypothetical protein